MTRTFVKSLDALQPSQLFVCSGKLAQVMKEFDPLRPESLEPIPVKELGSQVVLVDGHTRALAAYLCGLTEVRVFWEEDELDWEAYEICVGWCKTEGIFTSADLKERVVSPQEYDVLWLQRCRDLHQKLEARRNRK